MRLFFTSSLHLFLFCGLSLLVSRAQVITTIAGGGALPAGTSGVPATDVELFFPLDVVLDQAGNLYVSTDPRIQRISPNGIITTVAGGGALQPVEALKATDAALSGVAGLALDGRDMLYFADHDDNRVWKIEDGALLLVAGNGDNGVSGDQGPATNAAVGEPLDVALGSQGRVYILHLATNRDGDEAALVRRVDSAGIITTIAGAGSAIGTDNVPANEVRGGAWSSISVGPNGGVFISEVLAFPEFAVQQNLPFGSIRHIDANGILSTVAGGPSTRADGVTTVNSNLIGPRQVVFDSGDLIIADVFQNRVVRVSPDGVLSRVAGTEDVFDPTPPFGDGGPALDAELFLPSGLALGPAGDLYIADAGHFLIRLVAAEVLPSFEFTVNDLFFQGVTNGAVTQEQRVGLESSAFGLPFSVEVSTETEMQWLRVTPTSGVFPATLRVIADPTGLDCCLHEGVITVRSVGTQPPNRSLTVRFFLSPVLPPQLFGVPGGLFYSFAQGSAAERRTITLFNLGSGEINFVASTTTLQGGDWLQVAPNQGAASASVPADLLVTANPAGLSAGAYAGTVIVESSSTAERLDLPVTMTISGSAASIQLSQSGFSFSTVEGVPAIQSRLFEVLNSGVGALDWAAEASTVSGGDWLTVAPLSGTAAELQPSQVEIQVNSAGLTPGAYHGLVTVTAPQAENSPAIVVVVLNVLPRERNPGPEVLPAGLIFVAPPGGPDPSAQAVRVSNFTDRTISFSAAPFFPDGQSWFTVQPAGEDVGPGQSLSVNLIPNTSALGTGIFRGELNLQFQPGDFVRRVTAVLVVAPGAQPSGVQAAKRSVAQNACVPTQLVPVFTLLGIDFTVTAGFPISIEATIVDDCGAPLTQGAVVVSFSNGDPPLTLLPLGDGRWSGTWAVRDRSVTGVSLALEARTLDLPALTGQAQIGGEIDTSADVPILAGAVVSAVSFAPNQPVAPGSLVAVFGSRLADGVSIAEALPLPTELAGLQVLLGGRRLPLLFSSDGQVNGVMPSEITPNNTYQMLVRRGSALSVPEPVTVVTSHSALFSKDASGTGQGLVQRFAADGSFSLAEPETPARAGEALVIFCTGIGPVDPPVPSGQAAPSSPLSHAQLPVTVILDGQRLEPFFAGLAPTFVGLYQVNVIVPQGSAIGDQVPLMIEVEGNVSNTVTVAIAP